MTCIENDDLFNHTYRKEYQKETKKQINKSVDQEAVDTRRAIEDHIESKTKEEWFLNEKDEQL